MTRRLQVHVLEDAENDIAQASQWWQENRPDAPEVIGEEIARAFKLIS